MSHNNSNNTQPPPEVKTTFDVYLIRQTVQTISDKIKQMELSGITDSFDFEMKIMELYPEFYQSNPFLVKKIARREDLSMLDKMLQQLENVESGNKSLASVELKLGEELADQYLYPVINKK
jgi:hypothetical protein